MAITDLCFGDDARGRLVRGVDTLSSAVKATLGPKGRTVLIRRGLGAPHITNDGVTVARAVELPDPFEDIGAYLVRQVAARTGDEAGDGTTTATVLAQAIIHEGVKAIAAGFNPMDLKRGIDQGVAVVLEELKRRARPVAGDADIVQVGTIAANGDRAIGTMVAEAVEKVGREGAVTIEEAKGLETVLEVVEGLQIDRGYVSPYFVTDPEKMQAVLDDPYLLLLDRKLTGLQALLPLLEAVIHADRPLLVVADDFDNDVLAALVVNRLQGGLKVAAIKAPGYGERGRALLEDIAIVTGGRIISEQVGLTLETAALAMMGRARHVTVTRDNTTIVAGAGDRSAIDQRCASLRREMAATTSDFDRGKLEERLAKLAGGVAVIRVGGATEVEVRERKDRVDDAIHATKAATAEGVLPGGGTALLYASRALHGLAGENPDQRVGMEILAKALHRPVFEIVTNAGADGAQVVGRLLDQEDTGFGYDAQRGTYVDMLASGIIDPAKVIRLALQDAASVAGLLLTTEVVIAERRENGRHAPVTDFPME